MVCIVYMLFGFMQFHLTILYRNKLINVCVFVHACKYVCLCVGILRTGDMLGMVAYTFNTSIPEAEIGRYQ